MRLIKKFENGIQTVKVYYDYIWQEYRARLYINGKLQADADAFDTDKESILGTAQTMVNWNQNPILN